MIYPLILLAICGVTYVTPQKTTLPDQIDTHKDCMTATSTGRILQCIGSRYDAQILSDAELIDGLNKIEDTIPSDQTYYSMGVIYGSDYQLVIGKQTHFHFDAQYSIGLNTFKFWSPIVFPATIPSKYASKITLVHIMNSDAISKPNTLTAETSMVNGDGKYKNIYYANGWDNHNSRDDFDFDHSIITRKAKNVIVAVQASTSPKVINVHARMTESNSGHDFLVLTPDF